MSSATESTSPDHVRCPNPSGGHLNPKGQKYCGECGLLLEPGLPELIEHIAAESVRKTVAELVKDRKVLEVETAAAIVDRVWLWGKLFGAVISVALFFFLAALGFVGCTQFSDLKKTTAEAKDAINQSKSDLLKITDDTKTAIKQSRSDLLKELEKDKGRLAAATKRVEEFEEELDKVSVRAKEAGDLAKKASNQVQRLERDISGTTFPPEDERKLQDTLTPFRQYLQQVGFPAAAEEIPIRRAGQAERANEFYLPNVKRIVVGEPFVKHTDGLMREFTHHVLFSALPSRIQVRNLAGLGFVESALADYYPCSFKDDPETIAKVVKAVAQELRFTPPPRTLKHDRKLTESASATDVNTAGVIWGGAFWELRQQLGSKEADRLLRLAWMAFQQDKMTDDPLEGAKRFVRRLIDQAPEAQRETIRKVFQGRGLML
jgi:hypothetical protein